MNQVANIAQEDQALPADPMVSMIERVAMDPNSDLAKLERMLAMKERMDAEASRRAFSDAMADCQAEILPVAKNKSNDQTRSKYADLAAIYAACKPIVARHGFSFSTFPATTEKTSMMAVRWTLRHKGGHEESGTAEIPLDDKGMKGTANKTQTHAFGSTASYARRYLFSMIFDVATIDDDDGQAAGRGEPISVGQYDELRQLIDRAGITEDIVCTAEKLGALHDLPAEHFARVAGRLQQTIKDRSDQK
ncbi:ERF family protein [Phaeobacter sp. JH204B]|uniref:ERF family protein n=1 Tax=Phaeobacter sp. JH204B TaxID=3112503 RepID=UPI003A8C0224